MPPSNPLSLPPQIHTLLTTLHTKSLTQEASLPANTFPASHHQSNASSFDALMSDKFIAMDQDKCEFVYQVLRASGATTVVEAGSGCGVSTIYLAVGVLENGKLKLKDRSGEGKGRVIATEKEKGKVVMAREHWAQAGREVEGVIELREGDLRETLLEGIVGEVGFMLLDVWAPMALPALKAVEDKLKPGAVIIANNTVHARDGYLELFEYVDREGGSFKRITLPFDKGMDMIFFK